MCGRYTQAKEEAVLRKRFKLQKVQVKVRERFNIAPSQAVDVVMKEAGGFGEGGKGGRILTGCKWGLVPSWSKDGKGGLINARGESVHMKPSFRTAFKRRRCVIPADGFYEWRKGVGGVGGKTPYYMTVGEGGVFGMAGIWDEWVGGDGEVLRTCAIITTEANEKLKMIHDRMPVILREGDEGEWLDADEKAAAELLRLLRPYDSDGINLWPVSSRVNRVVNDSKENIERFDSELLF